MEQLLTTAYAAFNARDIDAALTTMHPDVNWPNGMEGGYVRGRDEIRAYWTRQWGTINPRVEPVSFTTEADERIAVRVHQVVHDLTGKLLMDVFLDHGYRIESGRIRDMEIRTPAGE